MLFFRHRNHAPMRLFAIHILELDGRVVDVKFMAQTFLYIAQNAFANGWRNVGDGKVAGERTRLRTKVPYVHIATTLHSVNLTPSPFPHPHFHTPQHPSS